MFEDKAIALFWGPGIKVSITIEKIDQNIFIQRPNEEREQAEMSLELFQLKFKTSKGTYSIIGPSSLDNARIMKIYHELKN